MVATVSKGRWGFGGAREGQTYSCKQHLSLRLLSPKMVAFGILGPKNRKIPEFLAHLGSFLPYSGCLMCDFGLNMSN
jgi:hypothetical protein